MIQLSRLALAAGGEGEVLGDGGVNLKLHIFFDFFGCALPVDEDEKDVDHEQEHDHHNELLPGDAVGRLFDDDDGVGGCTRGDGADLGRCLESRADCIEDVIGDNITTI